MTEDKIENLLQKTDQMAGGPASVSAKLSAVVRRRAHRRRIATFAAPFAVAAVIIDEYHFVVISGKRHGDLPD